MKVGLYARVSTGDQNSLPMQMLALKKYAKQRKWQVIVQVKEIGSGASDRPKRELILNAARQRKIDVIAVWRLDRWGRSVQDLMNTLKELSDLDVGFISLTEALDLTTAMGRAMAGLLAVFAGFEREIMRERVKAGIQHAREQGGAHGRPKTVAYRAKDVKKLFKQGCSKSKIAKKLKMARSSVRRLLAMDG